LLVRVYILEARGMDVMSKSVLMALQPIKALDLKWSLRQTWRSGG